MTTSRYIKTFLRLTGVKQVDVAEYVGIHKSSVNHQINGKRALTAEFALKLEKILPGFSAQKALYYQVKEEIKKAELANGSLLS